MKKGWNNSKKDRVLLSEVNPAGVLLSEVNAIRIDEEREVMTARPEIIGLCLMLKDGISQEDMRVLVTELETAGVNSELIEAIKLFEQAAGINNELIK